MPTEKKHKVIITGTGRAGTTFLVELLTELGLDTGYTPSTCRQDYHEHCKAGLEREVEDPTAPYIVKNPGLCTTLPSVLARGRIAIDFVLIPIRRLNDAALSRVRIGGDGRVPGGLRGTSDPNEQKAVLAENFHLLVETLAAHDIPHSFLHFPRFAQDVDYTFGKLRPLLHSISREQFDQAFARVAKPGLIHSFSGGLPADAGAPAQAFGRSHRWKRVQRRLGRVTAFAAFVGLGWSIPTWVGKKESSTAQPSTADKPTGATFSPSLFAPHFFPSPPPHATRPPGSFGAPPPRHFLAQMPLSLLHARSMAFPPPGPPPMSRFARPLNFDFAGSSLLKINTLISPDLSTR